MMRSVSSTSRYELVPPPAPRTAARPATLGACQVRLQLSMLLLPITVRANFWARKFSSFVVFEQLNTPKACGPCFSTERRNPSAARSSALSQLAGPSSPFSRTSGIVSRSFTCFAIFHLLFESPPPEDPARVVCFQQESTFFKARAQGARRLSDCKLCHGEDRIAGCSRAIHASAPPLGSLEWLGARARGLRAGQLRRAKPLRRQARWDLRPQHRTTYS